MPKIYSRTQEMVCAYLLSRSNGAGPSASLSSPNSAKWGACLQKHSNWQFFSRICKYEICDKLHSQWKENIEVHNELFSNNFSDLLDIHLKLFVTCGIFQKLGRHFQFLGKYHQTIITSLNKPQRNSKLSRENFILRKKTIPDGIRLLNFTNFCSIICCMFTETPKTFLNLCPL